MRRFEYSQGGSGKFWEVATEGKALTVRFGKLGTTGQTNTKTLSSAEAAQKEERRLIAEKTKKGYVETGGSLAKPPAHHASRRDKVCALYPFSFPDDLFLFWEFACALAKTLGVKDPRHVLEDALSIRLTGPFDVLAGDFDKRSPEISIHYHCRFPGDPPEFVTVLNGIIDGLHWGYFFDDPESTPSCVAYYYAHDAYNLKVGGVTVFEAVRRHLEAVYEDVLDDSPVDRKDIAALDTIREALLQYATADRPQKGGSYKDLFPVTFSAGRTAKTVEGMGIVVPEATWKDPKPIDEERVWNALRDQEGVDEHVAVGRALLARGYAGNALKMGKDLWGTAGWAPAYELLEGAYRALGRDTLAEIVVLHRERRDLCFADIFKAPPPSLVPDVPARTELDITAAHRQQLHAEYGVVFPEELYELAHFRHRAAELFDATVQRAMGPFAYLLDHAAEDRYHCGWYEPEKENTPEVFRVLHHLLKMVEIAYYFDDPNEPPACVCTYTAYRNEPLVLTPVSGTVFEAMRAAIEGAYPRLVELSKTPGMKGHYRAEVAQADRCRALLGEFALGERVETGKAYTRKYKPMVARKPIAKTMDGMGIVVPAGSYRALSVADKELWPQLAAKKLPVAVIKEAEKALVDGFAGTALKLGRDIWTVYAREGKKTPDVAYDLLDAAYRALGRVSFAERLAKHRTLYQPKAKKPAKGIR